MPEHYAEVACENCGTVLLLRYEQLAAPSGDKPSIGCPECQATTSVVAKWHDLARAAAPEFIHLIALGKETEIGLASERTMPAGSTASYGGRPMTPSSKPTEAREKRRADKERAEDEAEQRQEDNRHEQDAVNDIEEDAQEARQDDDDASADRGDP